MRDQSAKFLTENRHYLDSVRAGDIADVPVYEFMSISSRDFNQRTNVCSYERDSVLSMLKEVYGHFDNWLNNHENDMRYLELNRKHLLTARNGYVKGMFEMSDFWHIIKRNFIPTYGAIDYSNFDHAKKLLEDVYREYDAWLINHPKQEPCLT